MTSRTPANTLPSRPRRHREGIPDATGNRGDAEEDLTVMKRTFSRTSGFRSGAGAALLIALLAALAIPPFPSSVYAAKGNGDALTAPQREVLYGIARDAVED